MRVLIFTKTLVWKIPHSKKHSARYYHKCMWVFMQSSSYSSPNINTLEFCICSSVHRNSRLNNSNKMQQYADIYLLLNYSTCFRRPSCPSSGVHKTVVAASGMDHTIWWASFFKSDQIRTHYLVMFEEACFPDSMIHTRGCNYSFMYSRWRARWTPETCGVI